MRNKARVRWVRRLPLGEARPGQAPHSRHHKPLPDRQNGSQCETSGAVWRGAWEMAGFCCRKVLYSNNNGSQCETGRRLVWRVIWAGPWIDRNWPGLAGRCWRSGWPWLHRWLARRGGRLRLLPWASAIMAALAWMPGSMRSISRPEKGCCGVLPSFSQVTR